MNKKGQLGTIAFLIIVLMGLVLLVAGALIGWGVIKTASDEIIPELNSIGEVADGINVSTYTTLVLTPVDTIISNMGLIMGLLYIVGVVGILSYAFIFRDNNSGWVAPLFIVSMFLVVLVSILISQYYEEFYLAQDALGEILRSAALASYLVIYSPVIISIVGFIAAIILFTGDREERFVV